MYDTTARRAPMEHRSLVHALATATGVLRNAGVGSPRLDARLLFAHALGVDAAQLVTAPERPLDEGERERLAMLLDRRAAREPMAQILGQREFWSLPFAVTPAVLSPRPESETLVAAVLERCRARKRPRVLDLGTGSGNLLLAVLSARPDATGIGVDASAAAVTVAQRNAALLGLAERAAFAIADWATCLQGRFDIVLSNPPYIRSDAISTLMPEVARYEPHLALDGGADGLDAYRRLLPQLAGLVGSGGLAAIEIDGALADSVAAMAQAAGLAVLDRCRDLAGRQRCLLLRPKEKIVVREIGLSTPN